GPGEGLGAAPAGVWEDPQLAWPPQLGFVRYPHLVQVLAAHDLGSLPEGWRLSGRAGRRAVELERVAFAQVGGAVRDAAVTRRQLREVVGLAVDLLGDGAARAAVGAGVEQLHVVEVVGPGRRGGGPV